MHVPAEAAKQLANRLLRCVWSVVEQVLMVTPLQEYYERLGVSVRALHEMYDLVSHALHDTLAAEVCNNRSKPITVLDHIQYKQQQTQHVHSVSEILSTER